MVSGTFLRMAFWEGLSWSESMSDPSERRVGLDGVVFGVLRPPVEFKEVRAIVRLEIGNFEIIPYVHV